MAPAGCVKTDKYFRVGNSGGIQLNRKWYSRTSKDPNGVCIYSRIQVIPTTLRNWYIHMCLAGTKQHPVNVLMEMKMLMSCLIVLPMLPGPDFSSSKLLS